MKEIVCFLPVKFAVYAVEAMKEEVQIALKAHDFDYCEDLLHRIKRTLEEIKKEGENV